MATAFVIALTRRRSPTGTRIYQGAILPSGPLGRKRSCIILLFFPPHSSFRIISTLLFPTLPLDFLSPSQGPLADLVPSECRSAISIILKQHPLSTGTHSPPLPLVPASPVVTDHPPPPATLETRPSASLAPFPHIYSRSPPYLRNLVPLFPLLFYPPPLAVSAQPSLPPPHTDDDDRRWQTLSVR